MSKLKLYSDFARPFTLLPPALGVLSGAVTRLGRGPRQGARDLGAGAARCSSGTLMAARPERRQQRDQPDLRPRHRPREQAQAPAARGRAVAAPRPGSSRSSRFVLAGVLAWLADSGRARRECFWIVLFTTFLCWIYSAPPLRTKRRGIWANITIAIPRGVLLKVAGWSTVKTIFGPRALVHRRDLRPLPARRRLDQGLRRHRGRPRGRLPDPAHPLRRQEGGLDHRALLRAARSS